MHIDGDWLKVEIGLKKLSGWKKRIQALFSALTTRMGRLEILAVS